jgi:hypothetical protein
MFVTWGAGAASLQLVPAGWHVSTGEHGDGCIKPSPSDWCVLCELEKLAQQAYRGGGSGGGVLNPRPLVSLPTVDVHGIVHWLLLLESSFLWLPNDAMPALARAPPCGAAWLPMPACLFPCHCPQLRNVKRLGKQFTFGRQEDSHELYVRLMEAIEAVQVGGCAGGQQSAPKAAPAPDAGGGNAKHCCSTASVCCLVAPHLPPLAACLQLLEAGGKKRYDMRSRETTLIHHVFAGYTRGQIECLRCAPGFCFCFCWRAGRQARAGKLGQRVPSAYCWAPAERFTSILTASASLPPPLPGLMPAAAAATSAAPTSAAPA